MSDSKGKEPDVVFVGDSLVQLLHEFEVSHTDTRLPFTGRFEQYYAYCDSFKTAFRGLPLLIKSAVG